MKKNEFTWSAGNIIAAVALGVLLVLGGMGLNKYAEKINASKSVAGVSTEVSPTVVKTISYDGVDNKTALDLLKASHEVKTQDSSQGSFVTSIDGTENTNDTYWMFYVNGQLAPMGADQYQTKNGDKIEWRFEVISF